MVRAELGWRWALFVTNEFIRIGRFERNVLFNIIRTLFLTPEKQISRIVQTLFEKYMIHDLC